MFIKIYQKIKKDIKLNYEYEKARVEILEEEIKKLENMCPLDYLSVLNDETKEKLIGLCMDRHLIYFHIILKN